MLGIDRLADRPLSARIAAPDVGLRALRLAAPRISCVVPCFNEARNLEQLLPLLRETLRGLSPRWEIVLVDDGSSDETPRVLARWARQPGIRVRLLSRNFGKEAALTAGLEATRGDVVVMMDADLQHPPQLLPTLLEHWRAGADAAYAVRHDRRDEGLLKRWGARLFYRLVRTADRVPLPPDAGDFRLMDRSVVDALLALPERNRFMKGLYAWVGFEAVAVPYQPSARAQGKSSFGLRQLLRLSIDGLTAFSTWPLRVVSVIGSVIALLGFGYGAYVSIDHLIFGNPVPGWTTLVASVMLFSGVQMISLGVIGEYVGRIFEEVKQRPLYVVRRELGQGLEPTAP